MGLRILHTADWQLGKRFRWITGDAAALVREQRMRTVARIGEEAVARGAAVVLVAGDVFDMNTVETATLQRLADCLARFDVEWLLLPGNHDPALPESAWTRLQRLGVPAHVHLVTEAEPIRIPGLPLVVLPAPLTQRQTVRDVTSFFDEVETSSSVFRVGLAHGSVTNRLPAASEATNPIADTRADTARLDYLALGDWHGTLEIAPRTWYAGTPEPDRFRQNEPGHVLCVELDKPGEAPRVEPIAIGHYGWQSIEGELLGSDDVAGLDTKLRDLAPDPSRTIVSLKLRGTVDLAQRQEVEALLQTWAARFQFLRVDDQLRARASEDDLDAIHQHGYLSKVVERLVAIADDSTHADHADADRALQILHAEVQRGAGA